MAHYSQATYSNKRRMTTDGPAIEANVFEQNLWKLVVLSALAYIVWGEKISLNLGLSDADRIEVLDENGKPTKAALATSEKTKKKKSDVRVELPAGKINNLTFAIDPEYADRNEVPHTEVEARAAVVRNYLTRFAPVAVAEMEKFGIPASITLAQGLLESNAGMSKLARSTNNHFGIKCFSRRCAKGHCMNFTDDTHKDFFRKYPNPWGSFLAHSLFLKNSERYEKLFKLPQDDYKGWARGLSKAGYATDKKYGEKLIAIIQNLGLNKFDQ